MRSPKLMSLVVAGALVCGGTARVEAQVQPSEIDQYIEVLRQNLRADKVALVTDAMALSPEAWTNFWPIYREYDLELQKLGDVRIGIIKAFAENYASMTDDRAKDLGTRALKYEEDKVALRKKYYGKLEGKIGAMSAGRFLQVENQIGLLIDIAIAAEMPLIRAPK